MRAKNTKFTCQQPSFAVVNYVLFVELAPPAIISDYGQISTLLCLKHGSLRLCLRSYRTIEMETKSRIEVETLCGHDDLSILRRNAVFFLAMIASTVNYQPITNYQFSSNCLVCFAAAEVSVVEQWSHSCCLVFCFVKTLLFSLKETHSCVFVLFLSF